MTRYNYLGYGVTDSNGVAHLDHDAQGREIEHSYTGVGAGEVDVVASLDNPIVDGSIVSVPCNVLDAQFYCKGTIGNVNANWVAETGLTSTPDEEGNLLSNTASNGKFYGANIGTSDLYDYNTPFCIELKCISTTGARLFCNSSTGGNNLDRNITSYITGNNDVKLIVRESDYDLIVDGDYKATNVSHTLVNPVTAKIVVNSNCSLKYKDFRVYPI